MKTFFSYGGVLREGPSPVMVGCFWAKGLGPEMMGSKCQNWLAREDLRSQRGFY